MNSVRVCCCVLVLVASITANGLNGQTAKYVTSVVNDPESTSLIVVDDIGVKGAYSIARLLMSTEFRNTKITSLNLAANSMRDQGVAAIAKTLPGSKITHLDLAANGITSTGAKAIASSLEHTAITHLDLRHNNLGRDGFAFIINALFESKLTDLNIASNDIGDERLEGFGEILKNTKITTLDLNSNRIGVAGVKSIAPGLKKLTSLNLARNMIGDEGVGVIAEILKNSNLVDLNLAENLMTDLGARKIASALKDSRITDLHLEGNEIGEAGWKSIAAALQGTLVTYVTLDDEIGKDSGTLKEIGSTVQRHLKMVEKIHPWFVKHVTTNGEGQLQFVVDEDTLPIAYPDFVEVILLNKRAWIGHFVIRTVGTSGNSIENFVEEIEPNLAKFLAKLKIGLIERVKLLLECDKRGLKKVLENVLIPQYELRPRDSYNPHPLDGILHPAIYVLLEENGKSWFPKRPSLLKDLAGIFGTNQWDGFAKEEQLGEFGRNYGKRRLMEIIQRKIKNKN